MTEPRVSVEAYPQEERCPALQHDPDGIGAPVRCALQFGHDGLHDAAPNPSAAQLRSDAVYCRRSAGPVAGSGHPLNLIADRLDATADRIESLLATVEPGERPALMLDTGEAVRWEPVPPKSSVWVTNAHHYTDWAPLWRIGGPS